MTKFPKTLHRRDTYIKRIKPFMRSRAKEDTQYRFSGTTNTLFGQ